MKNIEQNKLNQYSIGVFIKWFCFMCVIASFVLVFSFPGISFATEEKTGINVILPNMVEFIPMLIAFIIVAVVLYKFGWPAFEGMLESRKNKIETDLKESENAKLESQKVLAQQEENLKKCDHECDEKIKEAKISAMQISNQIKDQAREDADEIKAKADLHIQQSVSATQQNMQRDVAEIAIEITKKFIVNDLNEEDHRKLIEKYVLEAGSIKD